MADDSTTYTYGPSQLRRSRTPIVYTGLPNNGAGDYNNVVLPLSNYNLPLNLLQNLPQLFQAHDASAIGNGVIRIDPNSTWSTPETALKHEATHQLLLNQVAGQVGRAAMQRIVEGGPHYQDMVDRLGDTISGGGQPPWVELPAYANAAGPGSPTAVSNRVPSQFFADYQNYLRDSLQKLNPKMAEAAKAYSGLPIPIQQAANQQ